MIASTARVVDLREVVRLPVVARARREQRIERRLAADEGMRRRPRRRSACRARAAARAPSRPRPCRRRSSMARTMTSLPCQSSGRNGSGGALRRTTQTVSSSGASATKRAIAVEQLPGLVEGMTISPDSTSGPIGWSWNSNEVTTPKLPPPPRIAQNRSGFSVALARTQLAVGGDHVGGQQIVDRQAVLAAEPAEAAAQREPGDPGGGVDADRGREAEGLGRLVELGRAWRPARPGRSRRDRPHAPPSSARGRSGGRPRRRRCPRCCDHRRAPRAAIGCRGQS